MFKPISLIIQVFISLFKIYRFFNYIHTLVASSCASKEPVPSNIEELKNK